MNDVVQEFADTFGCTPRDMLTDPLKREAGMAVYHTAPDAESVKQTLEGLAIARRNHPDAFLMRR